MDPQKAILVAIVVVLFAALAFELQAIEEALRNATPTVDQCRAVCSKSSEVPYISGGGCICKEPVSFNRRWSCIANATFENDAMFSRAFDAGSVMSIATDSIEIYQPSTAPATKVFGIFRKVASNVIYVSDANKSEDIALPMQTWTSKRGDCDDFSVLLASMYEGVGLDASIVEVYNFTDAHAFVIVRIDQGIDPFLESYGAMLDKYTPYYSEKQFNFLVFGKDRSECDGIDKSIESGSYAGTFYLVVESTAGDYAGSTDPFVGYAGYRFIKVGM
jgi:hypothetical protein